MEKYVTIGGIALAVSLVLGLMCVLVGHVVKMWRQARKEQKDMERLEAGSVWRQRPRTFLNDPFVEDDRFLVRVQETRVNSDDRMWVKYLYKSGLEDTAPADVFVQMFIYVEGPPIKVFATVEEFRERIKRKDPSPTLPSMEGGRGSERTGEEARGLTYPAGG